MPDDSNTPQNSISTENSITASPQEPTQPASENTAHSKPSTMPPEAPESSRNAVDPVPVNNDNSAPNEPLATGSELESSPKIPETQASQTSQPQTAQIPRSEPLTQPKSSFARELLIKARNTIQFRKRKKLDKIMALFLKQSKITNDEIEKYLHVSDATATRYLTQLEKEGKIKQSGKTGTGVSYSRI